ncbi:Chromatin associated protein KTI12 [Plasmodiophora brassicae]
MPLVVIVGHPSSGKSRVTRRIRDDLIARGCAVEVVTDESAHITRSAYLSSTSEREARSALRAAVERVLSASTVVIVDALNTIKGFRYELHCRARALRTTQCTVFVNTSVERCREWESERHPSEQYPQAAFDDLCGRLEVPNASVRWDRPLFTVDDVDDVPVESVYKTLMETPGSFKTTVCTDVSRIEPVGYLTSVADTTMTIVKVIHEACTSGRYDMPIATGACTMPVRLCRPVSIQELHRMRRDFLAHCKGAVGALRDNDMARAFVQYINTQMAMR